jgi:hypothetical protein
VLAGLGLVSPSVTRDTTAGGACRELIRSGVRLVLVHVVGVLFVSLIVIAVVGFLSS